MCDIMKTQKDQQTKQERQTMKKADRKTNRWKSNGSADQDESTFVNTERPVGRMEVCKD